MKTCALAAIGVLGFAAAAAQAGSLDVTADDSSGTVNTALFQQVDPQPTGTGVIDSFLRVQANGNETTEEGYNTDAKTPPFDAKKGNFTRSLLLSELAVTNIGGTDYRQFLLDLNESNSSGAPPITLEQLKVFLGTAGDQDTTDVDTLGTLVYNLDAGEDNNVLMYDRNSGSGSGDYLVSIPDALFQAAYNGSNPFVILYSDFSNVEGGFEEWAALTGETTPIPLPAAAWSGLSMLGVLGVGALRRKLRLRSVA